MGCIDVNSPRCLVQTHINQDPPRRRSQKRSLKGPDTLHKELYIDRRLKTSHWALSGGCDSSPTGSTQSSQGVLRLARGASSFGLAPSRALQPAARPMSAKMSVVDLHHPTHTSYFHAIRCHKYIFDKKRDTMQYSFCLASFSLFIARPGNLKRIGVDFTDCSHD